jgi:hypothetical protein
MTFRHVADMMSGYACADKDKDGQPLPPGSRWAYNDANPTWGDAIVTEPPDPKDVMNQNLKLQVESIAKGDHRL